MAENIIFLLIVGDRLHLFLIVFLGGGISQLVGLGENSAMKATGLSLLFLWIGFLTDLLRNLVTCGR